MIYLIYTPLPSYIVYAYVGGPRDQTLRPQSRPVGLREPRTANHLPSRPAAWLPFGRNAELSSGNSSDPLILCSVGSGPAF